MEPRKVFKSKHDKVKLANLITDGRFNREIRANWVNYLVINFKAEAFGEIVVSERVDGKYVIIDGQHRAEMLRQLGFPEDRELIPAEIHTGLSDRDEAYLTKIYNDSKGFGPLDKFKAMLHAGDPECRSIDKIVRTSGLRIASGTRDGVVSAVNTLDRIYRLSKPKGATLKETLQTTTIVWGVHKSAQRRDVLEGLALYLHKHPEVDRNDLIAKLSLFRGGPLGLVSHGHVIQGPQSVMRLPDAIATVIERDVMKKRRGRNLKSA